ncbi:type II toxin-antitoxin system VapC family toxin [Sinorhizobium terangae]|uniref:Ribonuclease VapC n=1 Tax=Sinorhizobium terangae TaxID=110322 RepID=A0A6N7LKP8_SINTE|nr:type II toxin-antitoxin system VapC family toxin [Sinorhizobium terangae]MBB4186540.1 ribonuclease VapC [Sinorhizobium terangae]MQX17890.1 PIN domain-containing protein [Sinorhizobium terangae]WFU50838.1 type II toxin-antitoxin system VapC family toxin [Sinorhizobium terangae]
MFLDASAIVAILGDEEDADTLISKIEHSNKPIYYSSLSIYEAVISLARKKRDGAIGIQAPIPPDLIDLAQRHVDAFIETIGAKEIVIDGAMHRTAIEACRIYGSVVAHPARLNFGDCFSYACARVHDLPLLFKGDDFSQTDIEPA